MPSASPDWIAGVTLQLGVDPVCALSLSAFTCPHRPRGAGTLDYSAHTGLRSKYTNN